MQIDFPLSNYGQPFEKDYEISGAKFTVRVLNVGAHDLGPRWLFSIVVKGHTIEGGPYNPLASRDLTDENVANHLASFWGHSQLVLDAQEFSGTPEYELDLLQEKCAAWMHGYLLSEESEHTDYDIVAQSISDDGEWSVVLRPNYMPNRLVEFYCEDGVNVTIHTYIEDNELSVKF